MKLPSNLSSCCGAEVVRTTYGAFDCYEAYECVQCKLICKIREAPAKLTDCQWETLPKLTPEQVKAVRWPEKALITAHFTYDTLEQFAEWAIRYALQDLMEGDDEK